jgi:hypothetical protein
MIRLGDCGGSAIYVAVPGYSHEARIVGRRPGRQPICKTFKLSWSRPFGPVTASSPTPRLPSTAAMSSISPYRAGYTVPA